MSIEDIKARLAAATPGPWRMDDTDQVVRATNDDILYDQSCDEPENWPDTDAEFIAHAPEDISRLIKAVEGVKEFHRRVDWEPGNPRPAGAEKHGVCGWCGDTFPCLTIGAITEALDS